MQHLLRRKVITLISCLFILPVVAHAQLRDEWNLLDHDEKPIRFGINLGYNRAHFNFSHHPYFTNQLQDSISVVESINSAGLNLAWLVNFNLSPHFDVRTF